MNFQVTHCAKLKPLHFICQLKYQNGTSFHRAGDRKKAWIGLTGFVCKVIEQIEII